ncbi:MAG: LemA family protein, partial [Candidatus Rokuibacteriota bacterium]
MTFGGVVFLLVFAGLVVAIIVTYNKLVGLRQRSEEAWSDIDVQLKRRTDLVPNLIETVRGYAAHERNTLDQVVRARGAAVSAQTPEARAQAENQLTGALRQLFALAESYPDLKA